jgi:FixJ family two-component response regulator/signal transduction histidine kinase
MYISPLIDPKGQQTGWMTSMTNITEAKRIRDQLSASHERFTTVLEGPGRVGVGAVGAAGRTAVRQPQLPAVVRRRCARPQQLMAGGAAMDFEAAGEDVDHLSGLPAQELTETGANPREVYVESLQKWFDVRARYLQWTDGRLAQMLIATDITARLRAEEQAAAQAEKAQVTSRLVTMGEMASSVAHELNQPLTAITNYCNGMVSRVKAGTIVKDDLVAALQKTARQAERAGQIIHRIRAFVKRSEPQRQPAQARQIVEDAVELAGIELRRRNVAIHTYVAQRLPDDHGRPHPDRAGGAEPAEERGRGHRQRPAAAARRHIELRVVPRHTPDEGGVIEFSVTDMGPGLKEEVIGAAVRSLLLDQGRRPGHRAGAVPLDRGVAPRPDAGTEPLQWCAAVVGCRFAFTLPVELPIAHRPGPPPEPAPTPPRTQPSLRMSLIPKKGTVYVVDDDEAVRDSLQWLLEGKDYRVKCFDSSESFLSRFDPREVACLIADIRMDGMSGLELQDRLLERKSPLPIVFITGHGDVPMAVTTMKKGAMDFIEKPFKEEELLGLVERMLDQARSAFSQHQEQASRDALLSRLTTREAQVLERIVAGRLNKQIADDLGISIKTVEAHRANIMEKLNANTVADLLKIALGAQSKA